MDEFAVWEGVMWPLKAEGVSDLFQVWEGEKSRHSSFPSLPCVRGRDVGAYAPPQIGGDPTVNLTPRETLRENESSPGESRQGGPEGLGASGSGERPGERCTPGVG